MTGSAAMRPFSIWRINPSDWSAGSETSPIVDPCQKILSQGSEIFGSAPVLAGHHYGPLPSVFGKRRTTHRGAVCEGFRHRSAGRVQFRSYDLMTRAAHPRVARSGFLLHLMN